MNLDILQGQHDELGVLIAQFQQAIADDGRPQRVGTLRWQFARLLMAHLALEDRIFYPNMQRQPDQRLRETAARLEKEMAPIAQGFSAYMTRWSDDRIALDWPGFCRDSRQMLNAILDRVEKEERLLYSVLAKNGPAETPQIRKAG